MKRISIISVLICAVLFADSVNCESIVSMNVDNVPKEGAVYQLGSMNLKSYVDGLSQAIKPPIPPSSGCCYCIGPGIGTCTFSLPSGKCISATGICHCCSF